MSTFKPAAFVGCVKQVSINGARISLADQSFSGSHPALPCYEELNSGFSLPLASSWMSITGEMPIRNVSFRFKPSPSLAGRRQALVSIKPASTDSTLPILSIVYEPTKSRLEVPTYITSL